MNAEKMPNILRHWGNANQNYQREMAEGLRDGMETKRADTLAEGPGFGSRNPHGSSQPSVIPTPGDPVPSGPRGDLHA